MWKAFIAAGALSVASALPAAAATLNVNTASFLTGASGVTVATAAGTKTYNVEFLAGTCAALFTNCGASGADARPFAFTTSADALAASQALSSQVFLDIEGLGPFDTVPNLTRGCNSPFGCFLDTPVMIGANGILQVATFTNFPSSLDPPVELFGGFDQSTLLVFARWNEVAAIPLPAGAPLVLTGLAALAGLRWRKWRERRRAQV